jgi:anti-anti-sigma factor
MQESGLEWLHRACQDPGRLAKRYLNDAAGLALHLPPQVALSAAQPRKPVNSAVQAYDIGSSLVVVLSGDVNARTLTQLDQFMQRTGKTNRHVILDLELAGYLGPDTLGTLVRSAILMKRLRLEFWLAAVPAHLRRVFRGARLGHVFSTATSVADAAYRIEKIDQVLPSELIAARSLGPEARERINVQLEFLKDLCERIGSVSENAQFAFGGFRTRASAGR